MLNSTVNQIHIVISEKKFKWKPIFKRNEITGDHIFFLKWSVFGNNNTCVTLVMKYLDKHKHSSKIIKYFFHVT